MTGQGPRRSRHPRPGTEAFAPSLAAKDRGVRTILGTSTAREQCCVPNKGRKEAVRSSDRAQKTLCIPNLLALEWAQKPTPRVGEARSQTVQPIQSPGSSSPNPVSRTARSGSGTGRSRNHPAGGRGTEPNCNHPAPEISFSNVKEGLHEGEKLQSGGSHSTTSSKRRRGVQNSTCPKSGFVQRDKNPQLG